MSTSDIRRLYPDAAREEWDSLARRLNASPFVRPGWVLPWHATFGTGHLELWAAFRDGCLVGVLPLQVRLRMLSSPTNWHTPHFDVLSEDEAVARELVTAAMKQMRSQIDLAFLDEGTARMVVSTAEEVGCSSHSRLLVSSPFLSLDGSSHDYYAGLSRSLTRDLRRGQRKLAELGTVSTQVVRDYDTSAFDELLRVEGSGWKARRGTALASDPRVERFYRDIARWASAEGWLRLSLLSVEGRAVAADFAIAAGGRLYGLKTGYDEEFRRHSPGKLLTATLVARAFDDADLESYEFLGDNPSWKMAWAPQARPRVRVQAFTRGVQGRVLRVAQVHGRPVAARLVERWRPSA